MDRDRRMSVAMIDTFINEKWTLKLPEHRAVRPEWSWWEAARLASMHALIKPNDLVFDIGAEEGDFPGLFASWGADVFLVEPNPKVWPNVRAIFEANHLTDRYKGAFVGFAAQVDSDSTDPAAGLTRKNAMMTEGEWPQCAYGPLIGDHGFRHLAQETDATPQMTIDHMAAWVGAPKHITMDIEGAELIALRGAHRTLTTARPNVWVSIHPPALKDFFDQTEQDVLDFMSEHDYAGIFLAEDHERHVMFIPNERIWVR